MHLGTTTMDVSTTLKGVARSGDVVADLVVEVVTWVAAVGRMKPTEVAERRQSNNVFPGRLNHPTAVSQQITSLLTTHLTAIVTLYTRFRTPSNSLCPEDGCCWTVVHPWTS
jgi:hypothetical protein